eukprot:m.238738 g.238738  ORF g.238738 m.238738 type:complete len:136 (+) comp17116_c2_seq15:605-1012(+)
MVLCWCSSITTNPRTSRYTIRFIHPLSTERHFEYEQAEATAIDFVRNKISCRSAVSLDEEPYEFDLPYDYLVIGVGATPHTFGIPGVAEHSFFLKEIVDSRNIRARIHDCFEAASFPHKTAAEIESLLTFVVVGC